MAELNLASVLTCPECGHSKREVMPTATCQFFYECESCKTILRPKSRDCCVFCSYGTVKCPPMQSHVVVGRSRCQTFRFVLSCSSHET